MRFELCLASCFVSNVTAFDKKTRRFRSQAMQALCHNIRRRAYAKGKIQANLAKTKGDCGIK